MPTEQEYFQTYKDEAIEIANNHLQEIKKHHATKARIGGPQHAIYKIELMDLLSPLELAFFQQLKKENFYSSLPMTSVQKIKYISNKFEEINKNVLEIFGGNLTEEFLQ